MFISIFGDAPGEGLGIGIFISIFFCGGAGGLGEADGICMPGMFICVCGEDCGLGVAVFCDGLASGLFMPGIFIPGILVMLCFLAGRRLLAVLRRVLGLFRFACALDFDMFIPGIFCMS